VKIELLQAQHQVDLAHGRSVATLALQLFAKMQDLHDLPPRARHLLEVGALLHDLGLASNPRLHHLTGRDLILESQIAELAEEEVPLVACLAAFHRKKVHPEAEVTYLALRPKAQTLVLQLAAILRVADGLDFSHTQTTQLTACKVKEGEVILHLKGPQAAEDGARAIKKADLWLEVFKQQVKVKIALTPNLSKEQPQLPQPLLPPSPTKEVLTEVGRRLLRHHFQQMLREEQKVFADKDPEVVHAMRVASRRLRAILLIISAVAPPKQVQKFRREIQQFAQRLGKVRSYDVFLAQLTQFTKSLAQEQRRELEALQTALHHDRSIAWAALVKYLESPQHATFKQTFANFITAKAEGWKLKLQIRDVAGSITWQSYEALRLHETLASGATLQTFANCQGDVAKLKALLENLPQQEALHDLRITGKRLRYVLEIFAEAFGPQTTQVLKPLQTLQEQLGELQDLAETRTFIATFAPAGETFQLFETYLASCETTCAQALPDLPQTWEHLMSETYRRELLELIVRL